MEHSHHVQSDKASGFLLMSSGDLRFYPQLLSTSILKIYLWINVAIVVWEIGTPKFFTQITFLGKSHISIE